MSQFVSSRFGLIEGTWFRKNLVLECPMAVSSCKNRFGSGTDLDFSTAMIKSMAEALERYTLSAKERRVLYKKTLEELKALGYTCFYPDEPLYEDSVYENFPYCKTITLDRKTDWVATRRLSDNQMIWLPASLIYYNTHNTLTNVLKSPTSNGMSCSFFHSAMEDSILELIERDTFLYMWLSQSPGEEIVFDKIQSNLLKELFERIDCKRRQIKIIYKYTDTKIPCIFILFKGKRIYNEPALIISAAADTDIERGCYRALIEFIQSYNSFFFNWSSLIEKMKKRMARESPLRMTSFMDHAAFYAIYENFSKCEFLFHTAGQKKLSELHGKWNADKKREELLKSGLKDKTVFIVDVTPIEIEKSHISITRAYSPDLMDLDYKEDQLFRASFKKKRIDMIDKLFDKKTGCLNSDPHCFP